MPYPAGQVMANPHNSSRLSGFARYAWFLIAYNLVVVVWGAWVRVSGSGAGCGDNWPHCGSGGEYIPTAQHAATWIEWTHRASTMVLGPLLLVLAIWAFRSFAKGDPVRKAAIGVLFFTAVEAWIGRHLVLNKLVVDNASTARAFWMSLHLANILFLIACLALTAWWASGKARWQWRGQGKLGVMWTVTYIGVVVLAITGALAALGDTLYPAESLLRGMMQEFGGEATMLLRTRPLHPLTATIVTLLTMWTIRSTMSARPGGDVARLGPIVLALLAGQYVFGWANLLMLAPAWAQLTHLLLAMCLWIGLVCLGAAAMARREEVVDEKVLLQTASEENLSREESENHSGENEEAREWSSQAPSVS